MSFLNSVPGCKSFPSQRHLGTKPNPPGSSINAEYQAAKSEQEVNETRIAELQDKLARAEVIDVSKLSGDTIKFGATVTAIDEDTKEKHVWQIVGKPEADTMKRKISIFLPLARGLIGKPKTRPLKS